MSFLFGVRRGRAPSKRVEAKLEAIAAEHECDFVSADLPGTGLQTWWSAPNKGEPWDSRLRVEVAEACAVAGLDEWCPRIGRPHTREEPIDQQMTIKVTASHRTRIDDRARAKGVTPAAVVREALDRHLAPWRDLNGVRLDMSEVAAISADPADSWKTILTLRSGRRIRVARSVRDLTETRDMPTGPAEWLDPEPACPAPAVTE